MGSFNLLLVRQKAQSSWIHSSLSTRQLVDPFMGISIYGTE